MEEESLRSNHSEGIMGEKSWRRNRGVHKHGDRLMEEQSWKRKWSEKRMSSQFQIVLGLLLDTDVPAVFRNPRSCHCKFKHFYLLTILIYNICCIFYFWVIRFSIFLFTLMNYI